MPRQCTICTHADRAKIEKALAGGGTLRDIARQWCVTKDALYRHKEHLSQAVVKAAEKREERFGFNLVDELLRINRKAWELLGKMEAQGDHRGSVVALREVRECVATQDEMLSRALKVQALNDPGAITCIVVDLAGENPATPKSLP